MAAPKNNQFWKLRTTHGREKLFESPDVLQAACYEYFEAVESNPLQEEKPFSTGATVTINLMRPFTLKGLFVFLDIDRKTWDLYRGREDFIPIIERIEAIIYTQKFEGAAVGLLKENLIARELGLGDKTTTNIDKLTEAELDEILERIKQNNL